MKAAIQVWAYGEQSEIRLPMRLWRMLASLPSRLGP
jgi:hypothetical protein